MVRFLRRHVLAAGLVAMLVPLSILLAFQYRWLQDLREKSAIAHQALIKTYLETIASSIEYFYSVGASRALMVPAILFTEHHLDDVAVYFGKRPMKGARRHFVLSFVGQDSRRLLFYDPALAAMGLPANTDEAQAAYVACSPWQAIADGGQAQDAAALAVDERDPDYRFILNPILDESGLVVGVAGAILDADYLEAIILPMAVSRARPEFFPEAEAEDFSVALQRREAEGGSAIGIDTTGSTRALTYAFTDHRVQFQSKGLAPDRWARAHVAWNMGMSILLGLLLTAGTILALRIAAREMTLSRMKSDFVSNVSHELRTPLASIRVFAEFLRLGRVGSDEKVREYGEYIEAESRRLTGLVDNILDFSRIESGMKTYTLAPTDVREVVRETIASLGVRMQHEGFHLAFDAPEGAGPTALADRGALGQAVGNLLENAVKYSGDSREVEVAVTADERTISIAVKDFGIGIPKEEQVRIFDRFHRVSTGLVHDVKGSGLGLAIVSHVAAAHGGAVVVASEPGKGSTFTLTLPATPEAGPAANPNAGAAREAHG